MNTSRALCLFAVAFLLSACTASRSHETPDALESMSEASPSSATLRLSPALFESQKAPSQAHAAYTTRPLRVAVVADINGQYGSTVYDPCVHLGVERLAELAPDVVLSAGDMIGGQRPGLDYRAMWTSFHEAVTDPLAAAKVPLVVAPGNHDASAYSKFTLERAIFVDEWQHQRPDVNFVDDAHYPLRHAFTRGPALFVALDATRSGPLSRDQRAWLDDVLTRHADRPVKVVYGHLPLYAFAQGHATNEVLGDAALEQLLIDHGVDLYISGHHQAYFPGRRGPLRLVGASSLAAGSRKLLGEEDRAAPSFLWIEIDVDGVRSVEALPSPHFRTPVERQGLPFAIGHRGEWIVRDDAHLQAFGGWSWGAEAASPAEVIDQADASPRGASRE